MLISENKDIQEPFFFLGFVEIFFSKKRDVQ